MERGKKWMLRFPPLLRDVDGLMKDMTTNNYKTVVPEKYLKEFGASLKSVKTSLLEFQGQV